MNRSPTCGAVQRAIKQRVLAMQHGTFQRAFANIVIQRCAGFPQKRGQPFPVAQQIGDGFAQTRVWFHLLQCKLRFQPLVQLLHHRAAVLLMKLETLRWRKFSRARLRIVFIYVAQRLQNIAALFREVRGHFDKLPASVRQAVGQQDLGAVTQFGRIA